MKIHNIIVFSTPDFCQLSLVNECLAFSKHRFYIFMEMFRDSLNCDMKLGWVLSYLPVIRFVPCVHILGAAGSTTYLHVRTITGS